MASTILHYEVVQKLGGGGMGIVHLARDTRLNRKVALKFLPAHVSADPTERRRFKREARAAAGLNHPNIAQVYAIEEYEGELFIVMEYVQGRELKEAILEEGLTAETKCHYAEQIARGIKAAHDKDIIHRDIKSNNIMVDETGGVKIMDFGLARIGGTEHITRPDRTVGTTSYMAPEQLSGREADKRSDIWAYGVVLYELFTGELPFRGEYEQAVMYSIMEEEPPAVPASLGVPRYIKQLMAACLQKDPGDRPADFGEIVGVLNKGENKDKARERNYFLKKPGIRNAVLAGAAVVTLVVLLAVLFENHGLPLAKGVPEKKYLAVLPIENIGNKPGMQAICDGLAETFSYRLSDLEKYETNYWVAPASEMRRENIKSATQARKLFGVNLAIVSSMQSFEDSTRLTLELVDADNIRRLGTRQIVVPSANLAALERQGVKAIMNMLEIETRPGIDRNLGTNEPSVPEAYEIYLKGVAALQSHSSQDSLEKAIELFSRTTSADPEFAPGYARLGEAYWQKYEATRDPIYLQKAESELNHAIERNKNLAAVKVLLGLLNTSTGKYQEAITHFSRALEIDPKYYPAHRGLAKVYDTRGEGQKAVGAYRRAIALKPDYWEGYKDLGIHYLGKGNFKSAIEQFGKVVELTPRNSTAYSNLGVARYYAGDIELARQMFERSLALEKNPVTANNLAGIYFWQGHYGEAAGMYEIALEAYSSRHEIWGNLAAAYELSGQKEKALKTYATAAEKAQAQLAVNPQNPQVLADLGAYYSDLGDSANALGHIRKALGLNSRNIRVRQRAVSTYEKLGMRDSALSWIDAAMISDIESQPELKELVSDPRYLRLKNTLETQQQ